MMLMILIMSLSFTFMCLKHPMSMGLILLIQTTLIALMTGMMINNFWFSYILFIIMIGGLLILFIYMTSIASNEKFKFSWKIFISTLIFTNMIFMNNNIKNFNSSLDNINLMNKFFNLPMNIILIITIIYLFITLIAVVKIINLKTGTLRQNF
nr:NADH dehydrogenase subunit 6 [Tachinomorphus sp. 1 FYJ-2024a]